MGIALAQAGAALIKGFQLDKHLFIQIGRIGLVLALAVEVAFFMRLKTVSEKPSGSATALLSPHRQQRSTGEPRRSTDPAREPKPRTKRTEKKKENSGRHGAKVRATREGGRGRGARVAITPDGSETQPPQDAPEPRGVSASSPAPPPSDGGGEEPTKPTEPTEPTEPSPEESDGSDGGGGGGGDTGGGESDSDGGGGGGG